MSDTQRGQRCSRFQGSLKYLSADVPMMEIETLDRGYKKKDVTVQQNAKVCLSNRREDEKGESMSEYQTGKMVM